MMKRILSVIGMLISCVSLSLVWADEVQPKASAKPVAAEAKPKLKAEAKAARRRGSPDKQKGIEDKEDAPLAKPAADAKKEMKAEAVKVVGDAGQEGIAVQVQAAGGAEVLEALVGALVGEVAVAVGGDPIEQQFAGQFRMLLKTELHFVRTICEPNAEQFKTIKGAGEVSMKDAVKKFADVQKKMQQGIRAGQEPSWPDPRNLIADGLAKSVETTLPAEKSKRYREELDKRLAARKRVALLNLVARLDKDLVLTAEQRQKLSASLAEKWKDAWASQLEVFLYGDQFMPLLPDDQIIPILNDKQKEVWQSTPKNQNTFWGWGGFGFIQAVDIGEEVIGVDPEPVQKNDLKEETE